MFLLLGLELWSVHCFDMTLTAWFRKPWPPEKDSGSLFTEDLEGQGDLVRKLITPITHIVIATLVIPIINRLTKSP